MSHLLAGARFSYVAGAAGTETIGAGLVVVSVQAHSTAPGTLTITPGGANQDGAAGDAIPLPASSDWFKLDQQSIGAELGAGSVFVFAGTDAYLIVLAALRSG